MANTQLTQTGAQVQADLNKIEGLPTPTVADSGKVVGVNSSGQYVLVDAGGGDTPPTTPTDAVIFYSKYPFSLRVFDGTKQWDGTLYYSYDHSTWDTWSGTTTLDADLSDGYHKLYLRGVGNTKISGNASSYRWTFIGEGIKCCGNLNNLLDYTTTPTLADFAFNYLFYGCSNVGFDVTLPATTLANYCYTSMFSDCISLTTAPNLPATTLVNSCYYSMFSGCTSLTKAPSLPATILANSCYYSMFANCKSLKTAPELPATTLSDNCYNRMFYSCNALTTPAKMAGGTTQATSAKQCCQSMYDGCTSLNIYTSASGHTAFYKSLTYSTTKSETNYRSSYMMFYNCYIDGTKSTAQHLTAGTQYYY